MLFWSAVGGTVTFRPLLFIILSLSLAFFSSSPAVSAALIEADNDDDANDASLFSYHHHGRCYKDSHCGANGHCVGTNVGLCDCSDCVLNKTLPVETRNKKKWKKGKPISLVEIERDACDRLHCQVCDNDDNSKDSSGEPTFCSREKCSSNKDCLWLPCRWGRCAPKSGTTKNGRNGE